MIAPIFRAFSIHDFEHGLEQSAAAETTAALSLFSPTSRASEKAGSSGTADSNSAATLFDDVKPAATATAPAKAAASAESKSAAGTSKPKLPSLSTDDAFIHRLASSGHLSTKEQIVLMARNFGKPQIASLLNALGLHPVEDFGRLTEAELATPKAATATAPAPASSGDSGDSGDAKSTCSRRRSRRCSAISPSARSASAIRTSCPSSRLIASSVWR